MKDYLDIYVCAGSDDLLMFQNAMFSGKFPLTRAGFSGHRYYIYFHNSEVPTLIDYLLQLEDTEADAWAHDIEQHMIGKSCA